MNSVRFENDKKLLDEKNKMSKHCEFCGHTISFFAYENDKKICSFCGRYNYRNDYVKFLSLIKKEIKENE